MGSGLEQADASWQHRWGKRNGKRVSSFHRWLKRARRRLIRHLSRQMLKNGIEPPRRWNYRGWET